MYPYCLVNSEILLSALLVATMLRDPRDADLLARLQKRDKAALTELYDRYGRLVYSLVLRIVRDRAAAEDLVQEIFLRVWNRAGTFDLSRGAPGPWLLTISRNYALDYLKSVEGRLWKSAAEVTDRAYLSVRPMLAMGGPRGGQLWLMSTPEGQRGFFWKAWTGGDTKWTRISVTALENARFSPEFLEDERNEMGDRMFRQEYLCEFVDRHDAMFSDEDIEACISDDIPTLW